MKYLIVYEKTATGFSAYAPDIDGCVATGKTREETAQNMQTALGFHFEGLAHARQPIPEPKTDSGYFSGQ